MLKSIQAYVFDLLHLDGKDLRGETLTARKQILEKLLKKSGQAKFLHYSDHVSGQGADMLAKSCGMGLEGIVSKLADSRYASGRQKSWLKVEMHQAAGIRHCRLYGREERTACDRRPASGLQR